jgi:hypothetical protein
MFTRAQIILFFVAVFADIQPECYDNERCSGASQSSTMDKSECCDVYEEGSYMEWAGDEAICNECSDSY